jgi:hypothetical protein
MVPTGTSTPSFNDYIDVAKVVQEVKPLFVAWSDNKQFLEYLGQITDKLSRQLVSPKRMQPSHVTTPELIPHRRSGFVSFDGILS